MLYGMTAEEEPNWAMITDDELERTVREIQELTPNIGQARLLGALRSRGLNIQRRRVRNCLRSINNNNGNNNNNNNNNTSSHENELQCVLQLI